MISLAIPVYNNIEYTRKILNDIRNNIEIPEEIFIIDDASTEDIKSLVEEFKDLKIKYVRHNKNMSFNYSCNEAIQLASGNYISFFNNDLILNPYCFKKIREAFEQNPNAGIVCPNTVKKMKLITNPKNDKIVVTEMGKREGWAWTARSSFIKNIKPIPSFLRTYYGDDYIFYCARLLKYNCLKITNNYIFHYRNVTVKKVKSCSNAAMRKEGTLWHEYIPTLRKEYEDLNTNQSTLDFYEDHIKKTYKKNSINSFSTIQHEIDCYKLFSCKYCPTILSVDLKNNSYVIEKYDVVFGNTKSLSTENIKRILFTISKEELFRQLDEILLYLKSFGITHRDINPGNLIFSEKERVIKLIDFYWAVLKDEKIKTPDGGINQRYGTDDEKALKKIKNEIELIYLSMLKPIRNIKKIVNKFGQVYHDGSSKHQGKSYSRIDIPYFNAIAYHRDIAYEYREIVKNLEIKPKTVIDLGCATGYTIFNLLRDFPIQLATGYEADPLVYEFLLNIKRVFRLKNINFSNIATPETVFPKSDLVICMNVHMWLHKKFGQKCDIIIKNLINSSKEMFFQTAGAESQGMYLVKSLTSKSIIHNYLYSMNESKKIEFIRSTKYHGGLRHLFKISGE